eukprot:933073-Pelagomonas_calceolata.AAC.1
MQDFLADLRYRQQKVWKQADALSPREVNKKAVTYHHWCGKLFTLKVEHLYTARTHFFLEGVMRNVIRSRIRAHCLKLKSCKWLGGSNICDKCECASCPGRTHVPLYCNCCEFPYTAIAVSACTGLD